jgi:PAS domain S-box-containing protein
MSTGETQPLDEGDVARLRERVSLLEARNRELYGYIREKTDHLLDVMRCSAGNADSIDDDQLLSLDPIGTITDSFTQVVENLHGMNERLLNEIDERFKVEEALRENQAQLQDLFDNALDYIQILDSEGRFLSVNKAWRTAMGYTPEEVARLTLFDVLAPESSEHCQRCFGRVLSNEDIGQVEFTLVSKDGRRIIVEGYVSARSENGKVVSARSIFRDITERKKLERNLLNAEKLESIGVLAGGIAHDFNNLLTAILGNISLALEKTPAPSPVHGQLAEAEIASLRARDLTLQLLTFSKGGAPIRQATSIADVIRDSAEFALRGSNARVLFEFEEALAPVEVDAGQFSQVIHNLVSNARQAMPDGGDILIRAGNVDLSPDPLRSGKGGRYVRIAVEDQGVGIPPELLKQVFDPFFSTRKDGSGLGLAVCHSVIKQHEGMLAAESRPGGGTKFIIHLPASESMPFKPAAGRGTSAASIKGQNRILIMDDEEIVRKVAMEVLGVMGYETVGVVGGSEAIEAYSQAMRDGKPFSAVLMDLTIPGGMGGKEAVQKMLELDPAARVIVSSGYSNDPVMADFRAFGFCGVIAKPYRIGDLRELLARVLPADGGHEETRT